MTALQTARGLLRERLAMRPVCEECGRPAVFCVGTPYAETKELIPGTTSMRCEEHAATEENEVSDRLDDWYARVAEFLAEPVIREDKYEGFAPTLDYFRAKVKEIADGRAWSATCTTTETAQSDGAGMRVLMWHAWIDGWRSAIDTDMVAALRWLEGKDPTFGPKAGHSRDMCVVSESGWSAGRKP